MTALSLMCFNWNTLVTGNKQGTALTSAKHNPGQLQTPQSLSVTASEHRMQFLGNCYYDDLGCSRLGFYLVTSLPGQPEFFTGGEGLNLRIHTVCV
jgi:hypothetical protein